MGQKIPFAIRRDSLCVSLVEECEGSSCGAGVDGLPQPVEYKHRLVEQCIHDLVVVKCHHVITSPLMSMQQVTHFRHNPSKGFFLPLYQEKGGFALCE